MQLQPTQILFLVLFWGAIILLWWLFAGRKQKAMRSDNLDPRKQWAQGIYAVVSGGGDNGFTDKWDLRLALSNFWNIKNEADFRRRFTELTTKENNSRNEIAWNLARAVNLSRMAAGAKLISNDESWRMIYPVLPEIQSNFKDWNDFGNHYLTGYRQWISNEKIDENSIKDKMKDFTTLNRNVWENINYSQPLN